MHRTDELDLGLRVRGTPYTALLLDACDSHIFNSVTIVDFCGVFGRAHPRRQPSKAELSRIGIDVAHA